jgi:hypothetical protein
VPFDALGRVAAVGSVGYSFYVDGTDGNDSNDGLTPDTAWQTVSKVAAQSFVAGESIGFKRGTSFRGTLTVPTSGTASAPIVYGAYGVGDGPLFRASTAVSGSWSLVSGTEYKIASALTTAANCPAYYLSGSTVTRLEKGTAGALTSNQYAATGTDIHVNVGADPGANIVEVPSNAACFLIDGISNVVVQGVDCRHANNDGISIRDASDSIVVDGVTCQYNANDGLNVLTASTNLTIKNSLFQQNGNHTNYAGDGLSAHEDSTGSIDNCQFLDNAKNGIANSEQGTWTYTNLTARRNSGGDYAIYSDTAGAAVAGDHTVSRCISYDGGDVRTGVGIYSFLTEPSNGSVVRFYNSTIVLGTSVVNIPRAIRVAGTNGSVKIKNVVVSGAFSIGVLKASTSALDQDYLCVNGPTTAYSGLSAGAHSISTAPTFVDASGGDFTPAIGSVLLNGGVVVDGITDGYSPPAPDIGAIER